MNPSQANIHPGARIGEGVIVEPFATIYGDVEIGEGSWIGPNAVIMDGARLGKKCQVFPGAVIAAVPQDLKYQGEKTTVEIGDNVVINSETMISDHNGWGLDGNPSVEKPVKIGKAFTFNNIRIY